MRQNIKFLLFFLLLCCFSIQTNYAQVSINNDNTSPDASAMLDIKSSNKGILVPRMTTDQRTMIDSPATGLLIFDTDTGSFWFYDEINWIDLSEKNDADADPVNEIQDLSLDADILTITNNDGATQIDLNPYKDNTDTQLTENEVDVFVSNNGYLTTEVDGDASNELQTLSLNDTNLDISDGNSVSLSSLVDDEDWVTTSGTNVTNGNDGNVGIGNIAATQNRWQLTVKDTVNCMLGSDTIDVSELFTVFTRNLNENNTGIGIGFQSTSTVTGMGAAIVHERTSSNSRGKLHFATKSSSSAAAEDLPIAMTINESGRLGIGITSPTEKLHVSGGDIYADRGTSTSSLSRGLTLGGARNGDSTFGIVDFQNYDSDEGTEYVGASIRSNNGGDATSNGNLRFFTYDGSLTERMTISESGEVGIGETTPQTTLDVVDQAVIGNVNVGSESTDQGTSNSAGGGFTTTPWLYTNAIESQSERGTASTLITIGADGTHSTSGDFINFVTSGNAQMTVADDGRVGIDQQDPQADLHIRQSQQSITNGLGGIRFEDSSDATDWWRIYHSGIFFSFNNNGDRVSYISGTGAYTVDSDRRLKKNIKPMRSVLERLNQMRPVRYHYKTQKDSEKEVLGFIAQEVQPLFPEMVVEGEDGKLGMTYATSGVIAIKAVQEQQEIIDAQHQRILELEQQVEKINALEDALKALQAELKK